MCAAVVKISSEVSRGPSATAELLVCNVGLMTLKT